MKMSAKFPTIFLAATSLLAGAVQAQEMQMPPQPIAPSAQGKQEEAHHHHGDIRPVEAEYPHLSLIHI